jgi:tetratricopeptide (TPR) repeat protein
MTQNNLGNAYADRIRGERAENLERAIRHYQQALEVRTREAFPSDWAGTQNNLGLAYHNRQDYPRAIEEWGRILQVDTENESALYNTACAYALMGKGDEACQWLKKAMALDEGYRQMARDDSDFDGIREEKAFKALMAEDK